MEVALQKLRENLSRLLYHLWSSGSVHQGQQGQQYEPAEMSFWQMAGELVSGTRPALAASRSTPAVLVPVANVEMHCSATVIGYLRLQLACDGVTSQLMLHGASGT